MHRWTLFGLLPCLLLSSQLPAEVTKLYTWQDQRGIRHFSQLPPPAVDYQPLPPGSSRSHGQPPAPDKTAAPHPATANPEPCDDLLRDEFHYRRHMIEERYQFNRLQCELRDINKPTRLGLASCYAKQARWRQQQYAQLDYLDACL